jgi:hypothetical protein
MIFERCSSGEAHSASLAASFRVQSTELIGLAPGVGVVRRRLLTSPHSFSVGSGVSTIGTTRERRNLSQSAVEFPIAVFRLVVTLVNAL